MPARNTIKDYIEGGFYHVYNRGVEKRRIFLDDQDYSVFLHLLKYFLAPSNIDLHPLTGMTGFKPVRLRPISTLFGQVEIHAYCLMPNHFHLLVRQNTKEGMQRLMRKLLTTYALYFNRRYERTGHLFQGPYKAVTVSGDEYLLHLSRYIHQNPTLTKQYLDQYPYSSYANYLGQRKQDWLSTDFILDFFGPAGRQAGKKTPTLNGVTSYRQFIEESEQKPEQILGKLIIEED